MAGLVTFGTALRWEAEVANAGRRGSCLRFVFKAI
jgi:hypothetical protein